MRNENEKETSRRKTWRARLTISAICGEHRRFQKAELSFRESLALSSQMPKRVIYIIGPTRSTLASTLADQED